MKSAKATLTFQQIGSLIEGKPVTVRLPAFRESIVGEITPAIELEIIREEISRDTVVEYTVTCKNRTGKNVNLRISYIDKVFSYMDRALENMFKDFRRIFGLPFPK